MALKKDGTDRLEIIRGPGEKDIMFSLFRPNCNVREISRNKAEFVTACIFEASATVAATLVMRVATVIDSVKRHPTSLTSLWSLEGHVIDPMSDDRFQFTAIYNSVHRTGTIKLEKNGGTNRLPDIFEESHKVLIELRPTSEFRF
ncbi:MAG: hypothetical protein WC648_00580 [Candidatus Paceibacterota bacterium]|jgi:hypothetical protein